MKYQDINYINYNKVKIDFNIEKDKKGFIIIDTKNKNFTVKYY